MAYKDLEKSKQYKRNWSRQNYLIKKAKVFAILGGRCKKCGNKDIRVMQIDHIEPQRCKGEIGHALLDMILKGKIAIKKLQLLCANCHQIKTYNERKLKQ